MRLLLLIVVLCVVVPLRATTIDWKTADWGQAERIAPNASWLTLQSGSEWAIRMSVPKTKLTSGSVKLRDANGTEAERGLFKVTGIKSENVSVSAWGTPDGDSEASTAAYQWFEWQFTSDYSKLFAVTSGGFYNEVASWSSAGLGIAPTEVCLFVSDADVVETALFLQIPVSGGDVPEPSTLLLFATLSALAFLCRSSCCTAVRTESFAGQ